jgi:hypothetical protein
MLALHTHPLAQTLIVNARYDDATTGAPPPPSFQTGDRTWPPPPLLLLLLLPLTLSLGACAATTASLWEPRPCVLTRHATSGLSANRGPPLTRLLLLRA